MGRFATECLAVRENGPPIWKGTGFTQMILSFRLYLIATTWEKKGRIGLVFCGRKLRTGTRVKEYRYQRKKCFGI